MYVLDLNSINNRRASKDKKKMHGQFVSSPFVQTSNLGCLERESQEASVCPWIPGVVGREDLRLAAARQRFPKVTPSYLLY